MALVNVCQTFGTKRPGVQVSSLRPGKGVIPYGVTPFYCYLRRLETNSKGTAHRDAALAATVRWTVALVRRKSPLRLCYCNLSKKPLKSDDFSGFPQIPIKFLAFSTAMIVLASLIPPERHISFSSVNGILAVFKNSSSSGCFSPKVSPRARNRYSVSS